MRLSLLALFTMFCMAANAGNNPKTLSVKTKIYCNHCSVCETCGHLFLKVLPFENGIKKVDLDEKKMEITVLYNPKKTTPEKIRTAISKLGYDADDVPADKAAYEKLDGCCKK
jgi:periplasmic mercuric ion binding protein